MCTIYTCRRWKNEKSVKLIVLCVFTQKAVYILCGILSSGKQIIYMGIFFLYVNLMVGDGVMGTFLYVHGCFIS